MTTTHKTLRGPKGSLIFFKDSLTIDKTVFPGLQGGINLSAMAGIAVALQESLSDKYRDCMRETKKSAAALAKQLMNAGLKLVCNGSENHLMIVKLEEGSAREITSRLQNVGIMTNPNSLSTDKSPFKNSGVRLGTPVLCTRGMKEEDMSAVSDFFLRGLHLSETAIFSEKHRTLKNEIATFLEGFSEIIEI
jgi:glycine hydroxymethyltransferase